MSEENILTIDDLTKQFGGLVAVKNVSFHVTRGVIKAVIGPNGAGKTTLFNLITGLEPPTSGGVSFKGQNLNGLKSHQRAMLGLSRTFQTPQIFQNMTALENVLVGRHMHGRAGLFDGLTSSPRSRKEDKVMREYCITQLEQVGLEDKADEEAGRKRRNVKT